jgi:hypothetical protein
VADGIERRDHPRRRGRCQPVNGLGVTVQQAGSFRGRRGTRIDRPSRNHLFRSALTFDTGNRQRGNQ